MFLPRTTVKVLFACVLAVALLLAQTLGMLHGVVHNSASDQTHAHSHTHAGDHADGAAHEEGVFEMLFAVHDGENDCRLYDQASQGGMLPLVVALALPVVLPPFEVAIFEGEALARWAALFDARGPPLTV
jgi:hypothetical protein